MRAIVHLKAALRSCVLAAAALACAAALLASSAPAAWAVSDEPDPVLDLTCPSQLDIDRVGVLKLPATTDPASIEVGIPCGMLEMCGQDPCLCGRVDSYGACACNGMTVATPTFEVAFAQEGVAAAFEFNGDTYLLPLSSGQVDVVITASLPHHQSSSVHATVYVHPFGVMDFLKIAAALVALAAVVAVVVLLVRLAVRGARKAAARRRERAAAKERAREEERRELEAMGPEERIAHESRLARAGRKRRAKEGGKAAVKRTDREE